MQNEVEDAGSPGRSKVHATIQKYSKTRRHFFFELFRCRMYVICKITDERFIHDRT